MARLWLRAVDLGFALALSPLWLPAMALGALLALVGQGLPLFYRAPRLGKGGRIFPMLKFRSMSKDADKQGPQVSGVADQRITPVGRLLRKAKLDEMPQFIHVLLGDMSIVGPRPESPVYLVHYDAHGHRSLEVKPGITGPGAIFFFFHDEGDGAGFEDSYIRTLLPHKLKLDADCAELLLAKPFRTTVRMIGWTVVAVVCRLAGWTPPAAIRRWC